MCNQLLFILHVSSNILFNHWKTVAFLWRLIFKAVISFCVLKQPMSTLIYTDAIDSKIWCSKHNNVLGPPQLIPFSTSPWPPSSAALLHHSAYLQVCYHDPSAQQPPLNWASGHLQRTELLLRILKNEVLQGIQRNKQRPSNWTYP